MELNTNFWATEQEDYTGHYGMKRFNKTLKSMITDEELPLNTKWDESISPWAINPRKHPDASYACDIINKCWMFPNMNEMAGIAADAPADEDMILRYNFFSRKMYYPFMFYCGDGGQGNGWPFPYWPGRIGMSQSVDTGDFTNYKENLWIVSKFDYSRLCFLIKVFVSTYGHNNQNVGYWHWGSWYDLDDITDAMWTDILAGTTDISAIRFVPYYANNESYPNNRAQLSASGFSAFAEGEPLDGSASGLGIDAPYTEDFIDYMLTCYAGIGTTDSEGARGGYPTLSLGNNGYYDSRQWVLGYNDYDWHWHWYNSLADWAAADNFTKTRAYQVNGTNSTFWKNLVGNGGSWHQMLYRQYLDPSLLHTKDMMREYIITQCAYLGCWFTPTSSALYQAMDNTNPNAYIGIIEEDGTTRGRYQKGSEIDTDQTEWNDPWEYSPWEPPVDPDPTEWQEDPSSYFSSPIFNPTIGAKTYFMTGLAFYQLCEVLESYKVAEANGDIPSGYCAKNFGTTDPMEIIDSVIFYPYDIIKNWAGTDGLSAPDVINTTPVAASSGDLWYLFRAPCAIYNDGYATPGAFAEIHLNNLSDIVQLNLGAASGTMARTPVVRYPSDSLPYFDKYKSFLAYEPYSSAEVYIPFCGSVKIDPQIFVGHDVHLSYKVSLLEGTVKCDIVRDKLVIDTLTGTMGAPIARVSSDTLAQVNAYNLANMQIQAQKANTMKTVAGFALGAAATLAAPGIGTAAAIGAIGGSALGAIGSIDSANRSIQAAEYQMKNAEIPFKQLQSGGGQLATGFEPGWRIVCYRPETLPGYSFKDWGNYGHTTGFACLENKALNNFSGLTVCSSVDLSGVPCTATEAEMIKSALKSGVYLPTPSE